jgi:hypothetical protein
MKTMVQGCTNGALKRGTAYVLGYTPWYFRQKYMAIMHA